MPTNNQNEGKMQYCVYQQKPPRHVSGSGKDTDFMPVLQKQGHIFAGNGQEAIAKARRWEQFRLAEGLAKFPIVELMDTH